MPSASVRPVSVGLGRAFGSALIFTLPILMTMEMWELGFTMDRWRLLLLVLMSLPMLMFVSHYSGFEATWDWREDLRDVAIAFGAGILVGTAVLLLVGALGPGLAPADMAGRIALQAVPGALGALLGRSQFGADSTESQEEFYIGELGVMAVGALYLGLNMAPTEEIFLIAYRINEWQSLVMVVIALMLMHGFVYASAFKGGSEGGPRTPWWSDFLRFTVTGYVVALLTSVFVLWVFGRMDGLDFDTALRVCVVLALPGAVGAAAARLII